MSLKCYENILIKLKAGFYGLFFVGIFFSALNLEARVFDISKQSISTYLRGSYAMSQVGKKGYALSSGSSTSFSDEASINTSGEFGVYFATGRFGVRFAGELLSPATQEAISGANSGGTSLMTLDSKAQALIYKMNVEYSWFLTPQSKVYLSVGAGSANVSLTNIYTLTAAGNAAYPGVADHTVKGTETLIMGEVAVGYEYNFSANTTVMMDLGWRQMQSKKLTHTSATTSFNGSNASGDPLVDYDGSATTLDLGGFYVGLGLRFYINY